jgi:hypothetical protein
MECGQETKGQKKRGRSRCFGSSFVTRHSSLITVYHTSEAGQALAITVLALGVLMGLLGLGIDVGYLRHMRTKMQQAADAAALAGASELLYGDWVAAADTDATSNGFTNGSNGTTITVNNPPLYGGYAGNAEAVEVIIQQAQPTFFMSVLGFTKVNVAARAVAALGSAPGCIYGLSSSASGAIENTGGTVTAACSIDDDSDSGSGLRNAGTISAKSIGVVGNYSGGGTFTPTPVTGIPPATDPLVYLQNEEPAVGPCNYNNYSIKSRGGSYILSPGVYCGGIKITVSGPVTLTFQAGTYILTGSVGLVITGSGNVTGGGSNVTFYNTGTGSIDITASATNFALSAPTSGTYAGILIFQNLSDTSAATITASSSGEALTGALYLPDAPLTITTSSTCTAAYSFFIASTIDFTGSACINDNYASLPEGQSPLKAAVLVE